MIGEKPTTLADSTSYVSAYDPAIDWERIIERELERPGVRDAIDAQISALKAQDATLDEARARRALAEDHAAKRINEAAVRNPASTLEELVARDGQRVTVFRLGVVPRGTLARIQDETKAFTPDVRRQELYWRCFLNGVRGIENLGQDGKIPTIDIRGVEYVDPAWLSDRFNGKLGSFAHEVGRVIWLWQQFTEDDAKK